MTEDTAVEQIAKLAAEALAPKIDPNLAAWTAELVAEEHKGNAPEKFCDPNLVIAAASLLVTAASVAWTIYRDIKKDKPDVEVSEQFVARRVSIKLSERNIPTELNGSTQEMIIEEVSRQVVTAKK